MAGQRHEPQRRRRLGHHRRRTEHARARGTRPAPTAEQLASILDDVVLVAGRLSSSYDRRRHAIETQQGAAAAIEWERACRADLSRQRHTGRLVAAAALLVVVAVVAAIVWFAIG